MSTQNKLPVNHPHVLKYYESHKNEVSAIGVGTFNQRLKNVSLFSQQSEEYWKTITSSTSMIGEQCTWSL